MTSNEKQNDGSRQDTAPVTDLSIDCRKLETFIVDYLDDQLPSLQRKSFLDHIKECPSCEVYVTEYKKTISLGQAAYMREEASNCEQMPEKLVQAILAASKKS